MPYLQMSNCPYALPPRLRYVPKCLREVASARASLHVIIGRTSNSLADSNENVSSTRSYVTIEMESLAWVAKGIHALA